MEDNTYVDVKEIRKAWLAGFFDGEDCITLTRTVASNNLCSPRVQIAQKCKPILEEIQKIYGGKVRTSGSNCFCLQFDSAREIEVFLSSILPYLVLRRNEAEIMLAICKLVPRKGSNLSERDMLIRFRFEELLRKAAQDRKEILCSMEE